MNPRWRMLLWEQGRTAGVLCLAFCGLSVAQALIVQTFFTVSYDVAEFLNYYLHYIPMFFAIVLTVRQGGSGHLVWNFEPRLLRLPVSLPVAFTIIVCMRTLCMVLLLTLNALLIYMFSKGIFELQWTVLVLSLYIYLLLQAFAWSYRRAPILPIFLLFAAIAETVAYRFSYGLEDYPIEVLLHLITHPNLIFIIPPLSLAMMAFGVYLERRDDHFGPPRLGELLELVNNNRSSLSVDTVKTPFDAQLWYEYRRVGRLLPILTLFFSVIYLPWPIFANGIHVFDYGLTQYIPLIAFPFAALVSGAIGRFPRSHYARLRPVAAHELAAAQCLAQLRALLGTVPVVLMLFFTYMLLGSIERGILITSWQNGYTDVIDLIVYCMRPLTLSLLVAWLMLWMTTGLMALITGATIICLSITLLQMMVSSDRYYDYYQDAFYVTVGILILLSCYAIYISYRRKVLPKKKVLLQAGICLLLSVFVFFGSKEITGMRGVLVAFTCGVVCVLPLTALTLTVERQRHGRNIREKKA